jgi:hypothetical protein
MTGFTDENIQKLFGIEDAENEAPDRLKEFFFRNKAYENLTSNLPIRILVGHKGVGKSALLKVAYLEDQEDEVLSLWLRPDDIRSKVNSRETDLNALIESWKIGLANLIFQKIVEYVQPDTESKALGHIKGTLNSILFAAKDFLSTKIGSGVERTVLRGCLKKA